MFTNASLRLSAWYVTILMALSLAFSIWVFNQASLELREGLRAPMVIKFQTQFNAPLPEALQEAIEQQFAMSQGRLAMNLVLLNIGVLIIGGGASYWLARRTLQPIESALEAQNRFTADASHELRTPLAAMKTEIEVALRDPAITKAELRDLLQSNLEETDRLGGLAQNLLTLARDTKPPLMSVPAHTIISEVVDRLRPLATAKGITIRLSMPPLIVMADATSLASITEVLLDNAIKYSSPNTTITIAAERKDGYGFVHVRDQGPGILPSDLPLIFDRFYRADTSRSKERVAGNGLGLSIAKKLATAMRGVIKVTSSPGKGAEFTLRLPAVQ